MSEYKNYGDVNFLEHGCLIKKDDSCESGFLLLCCEPYSDAEGLYRLGELFVDISDSWIDAETVRSFTGIGPEDDPFLYAAACTEMYSWANFGAEGYYSDYNWLRATKEDAMNVLAKHPECKEMLERIQED